MLKNNLFEHHRKDLENSGLNENTILLMGVKSLTLADSKPLGFCAAGVLKENKETVNLFNNKYLKDCMLISFHDQYGNLKYDSVTGSQISVVKMFYQDGAESLFKDKLPKYLCLPRYKQSKQCLHFPKSFDWKKYFEEINNNPNKEFVIYFTEGIKKAEKACQEQIPCVAIWSIYCFNEGDMSSSLISEIKEFALIKNLSICTVFDSDKYLKPQVNQAEKAFANKLKAATDKVALKVDLPQRFNNQSTKGLDDYLMKAGAEEFAKLPRSKVSTTYINSFELFPKTPQAPLEALPLPFKRALEDISNKLEGSLELAAMSLIASVIGPCYNVVSCEGIMLNMFLMGLSPTTTGKTAIVRECFRPAMELNIELVRDYEQSLKNALNTDTEEYEENFEIEDKDEGHPF
jgi:hypothetical protein